MNCLKKGRGGGGGVGQFEDLKRVVCKKERLMYMRGVEEPS